MRCITNSNTLIHWHLDMTTSEWFWHKFILGPVKVLFVFFSVDRSFGFTEKFSKAEGKKKNKTNFKICLTNIRASCIFRWMNISGNHTDINKRIIGFQGFFMLTSVSSWVPKLQCREYIMSWIGAEKLLQIAFFLLNIFQQVCVSRKRFRSSFSLLF